MSQTNGGGFGLTDRLGVPPLPDVEPEPSDVPEDGYKTGEVYHPADGVEVEVDHTDGVGEVGCPELNVSFEVSKTDSRHALWESVYWARAAMVPGVSKEFIQVGDASFRLGGLYMYAGFTLGERESNYRKYGENPMGKEVLENEFSGKM